MMTMNRSMVNMIYMVSMVGMVSMMRMKSTAIITAVVLAIH